MKIKNIIPIIGITSIPRVFGIVMTPSGVEIPESLLEFLNCPIGNVVCKNGKGSSCMTRSSACRYGEPNDLEELLKNDGFDDLGNLTGVEFCKVFDEVCHMIESYDPILTDEYIYDYSRYFTCNIEDSICLYGQNTSCQAALKLCWDSYPKKDCENLSYVCDRIDSGIIPTFDEEKLKTPSGLEIPDSLLTFLDCPIGNVVCKNGKGSTCMARSNVCRYRNQESLDELLNDNGFDIGNLSGKVFCETFIEVCDMIDSYNPPLTDDYVYNYSRYYTCNNEDSICLYGQNASCQEALSLCWDSYPDND
eukprot:jgi/Orpsp1_1/1189069/evm.model.d7180000069222.1